MTEITGRPSTRMEPIDHLDGGDRLPAQGARRSPVRPARSSPGMRGTSFICSNARASRSRYSRVPNRILAGAISDEGSLIALLVEPDDAGLLLLSADFDSAGRATRAVGGVVRDDRPARSLSGGGNAARVSAPDQSLSAGQRAGSRRWSRSRISVSCRAVRSRSARRRSACWWASRSSQAGRRGRLDPEIIWHDRLMSNVGRLALDGDGEHDPGQLLHPGHSAVRSQRAGTKGRITWAARCRTPSPTSPAARSRRRPSRASWP